MSHAVGLSVVLLGSLLSGATLDGVTLPTRYAALATLEKERLTVVLGAPGMFSLLAEYAKLKGLNSLKFPALRIISSSGAPLQPALKSQVESLFGMVLHNGYGVTECSPNISQAKVGEHRTDTSVGQILPGVEVQLVGSDHKPVADGEVGELWVRGPNVMKGYYHAPEETAAAINPEGWFNTRDLARLENGYLFIVGRTKELIGLSGLPAEEEAIAERTSRDRAFGDPVDGRRGRRESWPSCNSRHPRRLRSAGGPTSLPAPCPRGTSPSLLIGPSPLTPVGKRSIKRASSPRWPNSPTHVNDAEPPGSTEVLQSASALLPPILPVAPSRMHPSK